MLMTERQLEAMDNTRSHCVTAGAGTGKTHTLVEKYLNLLRDGVKVSEILALTFTEKAAAEMKRKVRTAVMGFEGEHWEKVRDDINWCKISTFHSFCKSVIDEFPLETGVAPGAEVLEEVDRNELLDEALDALLSPPIDKQTEDALVRILTDIPKPKLAECLHSLYDRRAEITGFLASIETKDDVLTVWKELQANGRREVAQRFLHDRECMDAVTELKRLASRYGTGKSAGCKHLATIAPILDRIAPDVDVDTVCRSIYALQEARGSKRIGDQKTFGSDLVRLQEANGTLLDVLEKLGSESADDPSDLTDRAATLLLDMKLVFTAFSDVVREMKRERNAIDFEDMMAIVHDLFSRDPDLVREEFTDRFRYILVDEFQDTDAIQSEIIWAVAGREHAGERLFIVGDPKQSIYLFRNVDVSMFKSFQEKIVGVLGGDMINLDTSFRSCPEIIGFVNHVFGQLMREAKERWEFEYQEMKVCELRQGDKGSVELLLLPDKDGSEAEFVVRKVQEIVEKGTTLVYWSPDGKEHLAEPRPANYGDIAILLRAKTHLYALEEALVQYGIPYRVHGGLGFFERQEITDLDNLLAFLSSREDDSSLYGILRSPYFALADEVLFHATNGGIGSLWEKLKSSKSQDENLRHSVDLLDEWLRCADRQSIPQLLMKIYVQSGIFAVYGGLPDGDQRIANLEKLLSMARGAQSSGFLTLTDFRRWLRLSREGGAKEGLAQLTGGDEAVKVMTVHSAKGLEFPIVFVPEMNFHRKVDSSLLAFSDELGLGIDAPDQTIGYELKATAAKRIIEDQNERKEAAERRRLLYVALTRAKDHLLMCGHKPKGKELEKDLWINHLVEAVTLEDEDVEAGVKTLCPGLDLRISVDPSAIEEKIRSEATEERLTAKDVIPLITGRERIEVPPPLKVLSPSKAHLVREDELESTLVPGPDVPEVVVRAGKPLDTLPTIRGTIVHEVLSGKDPGVVLRKYGIDDLAKVKEYSAIYERFITDPFMTSISSAHRELAFMAKIGDDIYKGRIDLLVRNQDGSWQVIDHKTGSFEGQMGEAKVEEYSAQMKVYQTAIEGLVKKKVISSLYLVDEGKWHTY